MDKLFTPYALGDIILKNRIVMAPMTRCRSTQPGDVPNDLMATYYAQRAEAGLILTEATQISRQGQGYSFTPGIYTDSQVAAWAKVVQSVHQAGGKIFLQLWHVGRMSHSSFHPDGRTVAPSAIAPAAQVWVADETGQGTMLDCPVPHALTLEEIKDIIGDYARASRRARDVGFDGVEIHAANGYLLDEFMRSSSNKREDIYGGSIDKRLRLVKEVIDAVSAEIGAERVGIRLSPHNTSRGMDCPEMIETTYALASLLKQADIAYIHFAEADWDNAPEVPLEFRQTIRSRFPGTLIVAGKYDKQRAEAILDADLADLVAFGRPFIANPDLPHRLLYGLPLADFNPDQLFGGNQQGYTDYPPFS